MGGFDVGPFEHGETEGVSEMREVENGAEGEDASLLCCGALEMSGARSSEGWGY